jgi:hypothetical protein
MEGIRWGVLIAAVLLCQAAGGLGVLFTVKAVPT